MPRDRPRDISPHIIHVASAIVHKEEWVVMSGPFKQTSRDYLRLGCFTGIVFWADNGGDVLMVRVYVYVYVYVFVWPDDECESADEWCRSQMWS